jgi:cytochrome bd-type quinol oxidase subunit 2
MASGIALEAGRNQGWHDRLRMKKSTTLWAALAVISFFLITLAALLEMYAGMAWAHRAGAATSGRWSTGFLSLLAAACVVTVIEFIRGRAWAWWMTLMLAAMVLAFGLFCLVCAFRPLTPFEHSEFPFLIMAGIVFAVPAAITGALLNLPAVRRRFLG